MSEMDEGGLFSFRDDKLFFSHPDKENDIEIDWGFVIANGLRDLCITKKKGITNIEKISKVNQKDVFYYPQGDILWLVFVKPTRDGSKSMFLDLGTAQEESRPFMNTLLRRFGSIKNIHYDMYAGTDWTKPS